MTHGSPVNQKFEIDNAQTAQSLYQKFAFVKSIIENDIFNEAIHKIIQNPVKSWKESIVERRIDNVGRIGKKEMRQIVSNQNRIASNLIAGLCSLPRSLHVPYKKDTTDNSENQFIKFVLTELYSFCQEIERKKNASLQLKRESEIVGNSLLNYLSSDFFKEIQVPNFLNFNSPILQRKEGYREILQTWLIFDLAAKLNWKGGDNVYEAGKRNVAALYEYWIFFKLLDIVSEVFNIPPKEKEKLVESDRDQLNLWIRQGRMIMMEGSKKYTGRTLNVRFYYNRTFGHKEDIHAAGSWTMPMRPDYTLTLWPGEITEAEAEEQDVIVHIHFDAKYRLNKILIENEDTDLSNIDCDENPLSVNLSEEKEKEELGTYEIGMYKRADLLKMHAYKDAIRRTSGAYIIYPGSERCQKSGYHEIIPGLGAFCISPGTETDQVAAIKRFLIDVRTHMLRRSTQREKMAYQTYNIYRDKPSPLDSVMESLPESIGENRDFQPDETYVLIGYCDPANQNFILDKGMYNVRTGHRKGAIDLHEFMKANYVLIWNEYGWQTFQKLNKKGFKVFSEKYLVNLGYTPSKVVDLMKRGITRDAAICQLAFDDYYSICSFSKRGVEKEFRSMKWKCLGFRKTPHCVKLSTLMKHLN